MNKFIFATSTKKNGNMSATFGLEKAVQNRERFIQSVSLDPEGLVVSKQIHGNNIVKVDKSLIGLAKTNTPIADADAMVTNDPKVVLAVFIADCLPIFFYDDIAKCFGIAHAGRKGTIANITGKTVKALIDNFQVKAQNIKVTFGPCIHKCHYEQQKPEDTEKIEKFRLLFPSAVEQKNSKYYFDLILANQTQLINAGIRKGNIDHASSECTECHKEKYWSYHKVQKLEGVMMSVIGCNKND